MTNYEPYEKRTSQKIQQALSDIWPSVYRTLNNILFSIVGFIKELMSNLLQGWKL